MIQRIPGGGVHWPPKFDESATTLTAGNIFRLNADGQYTALVFRAPRAGTIVGCDLCLGAVANAPDNGLRIGRQGITAATGFPDGTWLGSVTTAAGQPSAAGWVTPGNWDTSQVVTRGELVCLVVAWGGAFTTGDSVVVGATVMTSSSAMPYGKRGATEALEVTYLPLIFARYDDGTYAEVHELAWPMSALTLHAHVTTASTPDEIGIAFTLPVPVSITKTYLQTTVNTATSDYDVILYDAAGRVLVEQSVDVSVMGDTGHRQHDLELPRDVRLDAGVEYLLAWRPSTANSGNLRPYYAEFPSAVAADVPFGGRAWYMVARTDGGAWTRYNNSTNGFRRLRGGIVVTGVDDGAVSPRTRALRRPAR